MQIANNIEIVCSECGKCLPIELSVGRDTIRDVWIFKVYTVHVCKKKEGNLKKEGE